jgi:Fic/DOC family
VPIALLACCPEPRLGPETPKQRQLLARIAAYAERAARSGPEASFGLELRAAYVLDREAKRETSAQSPPPYAEFFLRPAIEPILHSYFDHLRPGALDPDAADNFLSCLHGAPIRRRTGPCRITPNVQGNFVEFPQADAAQDYHRRLDRHLPTIEGALQRAAYAYAEVLLSHPYGDGNGRLARALILTCLAQGNRDRIPFLPLGPAFYAHAPAIAGALESLAVSANWGHFLAVFEDFVETGLRLASRLTTTSPE